MGVWVHFAIREGEVSEADLLRPVFAVDEVTVTTDPGHPERERCGRIVGIMSPTLVTVEVLEDAIVWQGGARAVLRCEAAKGGDGG